MKYLLLISLVITISVSCSKNTADPKIMTVEQLRVETGIDLITAWDL